MPVPYKYIQMYSSWGSPIENSTSSKLELVDAHTITYTLTKLINNIHVCKTCLMRVINSKRIWPQVSTADPNRCSYANEISVYSSAYYTLRLTLTWLWHLYDGVQHFLPFHSGSSYGYSSGSSHIEQTETVITANWLSFFL